SFLRIGEPGFLSLSLSDQSDLIINDKIYGKANGWTHLLIQKSPNNSLSVSMNGELKTTISYGGLSKKIQIGVSTSVSSGSVHILDFRLYQKLLTDREVKKLYNNTWDMNYDVPDCRCPVSHPALDSSGYICYGDANSQQPRLEKALRNISAITDGSSNTSWVSGNASVTTLTIELGNSFQISSIQLLFLGTLPYNAAWMYYLNNGNIDMSQFTCNKTGCQLNGNVNDYETYLKTVADKIEVNLHSSENLIISQLIVHGSCNCNGNADNCMPNSSSNDYTCDCIAAHNKEGKHCEDCKNMYYRLTDEFVCNRSCPNCNTHGRNPNRHCMQIGGNCSCKANVEGTLCDMCKHLTYNLGPSTEGCTQSNCSSDGSESCNNETGSCNCYPNVNGTTCDSCSVLHYNITSGRGCEPCLCSSKGTMNTNLQCNVTSGKCGCKTNVTGRQCDECKDDYWNLESTNDVGCTKCGCNMIGSTSSACDKQTGQCPCWNNDYSNTKCNPTSTSVIPKFGPQVGGTLVTVSGHLLNGSSMYFPKIYLDETIPPLLA
ncbi:usherin-like, partial [Gigantopelta aegis]|uniref:usherin-like n=1 Tax=Gigantopelta aegis TaxID=1735272 RepID=UPI001B88BC21